ncbi:MAG: conjugal transfer protein, partial [Haloferacaceae archaeon]
MNREYIRVTPTSAPLDPDSISTALSSLHKLSSSTSEGFGSWLNPLRSTQPPTFEFVAVSEGPDEPVEFYYGADNQLDVLKQRLRTIYPSSFDIDRVQVDLVKKLLQPREYPPEEVRKRLEQGQLYDTKAVDFPTNQDSMVGADGGTIHARPSLDDVTPYGVRWRGSVDRRKDW